MGKRVVWLPGVLGSNLGVRGGAGALVRPVWIDPPTLLLGGMLELALGPDGFNPPPNLFGLQTVVQGVFLPAYGALPAWLLLNGYQVLSYGYDWRKDLVTVGQQAWADIAAWAGRDPVWIVTHSMGGLLARCVYGAALNVGAAGQIAGIVTIGCPHFGSLEIVRLFYRLPILYQGIRGLCGWGAEQLRGYGQQWLDATLASMPGWYELLPWRGAGPLFAAHPDQAAAIYQPSFYAGGNAFVSNAWLTLATSVQGILQGWLPTAIMTSIAGVGHKTAESLSGVVPPDSDAGYVFTDVGDGTVTVAQASPPGVPVIQVASAHPFQSLDPVVWGLVRGLIG